MTKQVRFLTQAAIIAALYAVLTHMQNLLVPGSATWMIQMRMSEALCVLAFFTPAAIPGLYVGCLLGNIASGCALPDIIFGPLATLIGALGTWGLSKAASFRTSKPASLFVWLSPLPPILANGIVIPPVLKYAYGVGPVWFSAVTVTLGEVISCGIFGLVLLFALRRYRKSLFPCADGFHVDSRKSFR